MSTTASAQAPAATVRLTGGDMAPTTILPVVACPYTCIPRELHTLVRGKGPIWKYTLSTGVCTYCTYSLLQAAIDPHSVLEQLDPLLGQTGCIRSSKEVGKIVRYIHTYGVYTQHVNRCVHCPTNCEGRYTCCMLRVGGGLIVLSCLSFSLRKA